MHNMKTTINANAPLFLPSNERLNFSNDLNLYHKVIKALIMIGILFNFHGRFGSIIKTPIIQLWSLRLYTILKKLISISHMHGKKNIIQWWLPAIFFFFFWESKLPAIYIATPFCLIFAFTCETDLHLTITFIPNSKITTSKREINSINIFLIRKYSNTNWMVDHK